MFDVGSRLDGTGLENEHVGHIQVALLFGGLTKLLGEEVSGATLALPRGDPLRKLSVLAASEPRLLECLFEGFR
jgi:hypothetical protein